MRIGQRKILEVAIEKRIISLFVDTRPRVFKATLWRHTRHSVECKIGKPVSIKVF